MNGENSKITENDNQKLQNKPQIDPFLVISGFNEQFINQQNAFKTGQQRFENFAKKEQEILATEGIDLVQTLRAKLLYFKVKEKAILYTERLKEVEAKLEFTQKILELAKDKKCKIVGSMLIIDEINSDSQNKNLVSASLDLDEIDNLIEELAKSQRLSEKQKTPFSEVPKSFYSAKKPTVVTTKRSETTKDLDFDEIANKILNSVSNKNSQKGAEEKTNFYSESDLEAQKENEENESLQNKSDSTDQSNANTVEDYPFYNSETEYGNVDVFDSGELEIIKTYKSKDNYIDLLQSANSDLIYGLYNEDSFNETFNKLLDVVYCYPLSITTLPDVAIEELKSHETVVSINGVEQNITTFEYMVRFVACVILRKGKSKNFKNNVLQFYHWCQSVNTK